MIEGVIREFGASCTHEPLRASIYATNIGRDVIDQRRVWEVRPSFPSHVYSSLINRGNESSTCKEACSHRPPEKLVCAYAGHDSHDIETDSHTDTTSDVWEGLA